jgi:multiple sugar transport system substrate-binding protein
LEQVAIFLPVAEDTVVDPAARRNAMTQRKVSLTDRIRLRDEAIIDFSKHYINRREFMRRMTAVGVGAVAAGRIADTLASPAASAGRSRWSKQADATIRFVKGVHAPNDAELWEGLKADFEAANPGIVLQPEFYDWATMPEQLTAGYASDDPWDVVYNTDQVLARWVSEGLIADITAQTNDTAWADERNGIAPFTWDVVNVGGSEYGVGVLGAVFNIWYNLNLFEEAGITEFPTTRQGLRDAAIALTKDGVYGFELRDTVADSAFWDWFPYIHNDGADILTEDLTAQNLDPLGAAGTQFLSDLQSVDKVTPEVGAYDWDGQAALFAAGRVAILHDESWRTTVWDQDPGLPFEYEVTMAPPGEDGSKQTAMGNFGYATISEASEQKEAAWEFVKWWAQADVINPYAATIGLQTVRVDSVPPYENAHLQKIQAELVPKVQPPQIHVNWAEMVYTMWPEVERAYRGEQTGEEAMAKAAEIINGLI